MGETVPLLKPTFNRSIEIESRPDHLTADAGALIQREIMERSGIIDWLVERLHDPRNQSLVTYPLADLLRTHLLLLISLPNSPAQHKVLDTSSLI